MRIPRIGTRNRGQEGQGMVEYVLIVVLVVVVALVAFRMFGSTVKEKMETATGEVAGQGK